MKKLFLKFPVILMLLFAVACSNERANNQAEDSNEVAEETNDEKFDDKDVKDDADFVAEQVAANYAELEMAKLAAQRSSVSDIKTIAQKLETEHSKKLEELKSLAQQKSITVPTEAEDDAKKTVRNLSEEKDADDFNEEWCKEMVDKHEKKIEAYEDQMEKTEDPELKNWIGNTLPSLRTHLDQLKACHEKLKDA